MDLKKEIAQAVVIINDDENFEPLTLDQPKVLFNMINQPIFQYTIDMLITSNIQEIFIFCNQHHQKIKDFINKYKSTHNNTINIQVYFSEDFTNLGSVMRNLDSKGIIKSNFILINGDCIGNIKLNELIDKHKENIKSEPGCVMTCIFRKMLPNHQSRIKTKKNSILCLDSNKKLVFFEKSLKKNINLPTKLFEEDSISIHYDVFDTQISICSEKVPLDFNDNFDLESRENFINGLLADVELRGHYIFGEILDNGYAARVEDIYSYENIFCDILKRFVFPVVPDIEQTFLYKKNNVYLQDKVQFASKEKTLKNVAIGENSSIGSQVIIVNSVIGKNCIIGDNVEIQNSYIYDNVKIEPNCKVEHSIIDSNVCVTKNHNLRHCLIAKNVIIDNDVVMKKLYFDSTLKESDLEIVGKNGRGKEYINDENEEDDDIDSNSSNGDDGEDFDTDSTSFSDSENSENSSDKECDASIEDEYSIFFTEVFESISRGIEEKSIVEKIILEINSSKHAYNVPMNIVNSFVIKVLLQITMKIDGNFFANLKSNLIYCLPIIQNYIKSNSSQNDCIYTLEEFILNNEANVSYLTFVKIIQFFYQENILEEEIILNWFYEAENLPDHDTEEQAKLRKSKEIQLFIKWLEEAEEESSNSEE